MLRRLEREVIKKKIIIIFLVLICVFFVAWKLNKQDDNLESTVTKKVNREEFISKGINPGNSSDYDIKLTMDNNGNFQFELTGLIKNLSTDDWEQLTFYFIPNIFTKSVSPELENPSTVNFHNISIDRKKVVYTLERDTLNIQLPHKLKPNQEVKVYFSYELTFPEQGLRFTKSNNGNFHLAQFYPMLATYSNSRWNKESYQDRGETYHTGFSNFKLTYDIPKGFTFVSSSDKEVFPSSNVGSIEAKNIKEIFVAILKDPILVENDGGPSVRVFGFNENKEKLYREIADEAIAAINYFEEIMGPYPFKQFDIIVDGMGMEYPGIVTVGSIYNTGPSNSQELKNMVIHEIAHQWFYGIVSNDPYSDAWLDEGFAVFAASLFKLSKLKETEDYNSMYRLDPNLELPVNLPLDQYESNMSSYVYGKSAIKLWELFKDNGEVKEAEKFLKSYYHFYRYKEVDTREFVRFVKYYFDLKDDTLFEGWLELEK